jgi:hypothetical protein
MRLHVDLLGWFHVIWGVFGGLAGLSLAVLAAGGHSALAGLEPMGAGERAIIWLCATAGGVLLAFGLANIAVGRALHRRRAAGRLSALALSVPNLVVVPFGTALGVYTYWVLLNDEARRQFEKT